MTDTLKADPEYRASDKAIVMLVNDGDGEGGLVADGYDDDTEAMADMFLHLKAVFEANGKTLMLAALGAGSPN